MTPSHPITLLVVIAVLLSGGCSPIALQPDRHADAFAMLEQLLEDAAEVGRGEKHPLTITVDLDADMEVLRSERERITDIVAESMLRSGRFLEGDKRYATSLAEWVSWQVLLEGVWNDNELFLVQDFGATGTAEAGPWCTLLVLLPSDLWEEEITVPLSYSTQGWKVCGDTLQAETTRHLKASGLRSEHAPGEAFRIDEDWRARGIQLKSNSDGKVSFAWSGGSPLLHDDQGWEKDLDRFSQILEIELDPYEAEAGMLCDADIPISYLTEIALRRPSGRWNCSLMFQGPMTGTRFAIPVALCTGNSGAGQAREGEQLLPSFHVDEEGRVVVQVDALSQATPMDAFLQQLIAAYDLH